MQRRVLPFLATVLVAITAAASPKDVRTVNDVDIRSWRDTAIVTGRARTRGDRLGHQIDEEVRYTRTYYCINKQWQLAAEHVTRIE
jgi:hypothetical protein